MNIDTGIDKNNRTVNDTSAADPEYNAFFTILQNATQRSFPAQSSVEAQYSFVVPATSMFALGWTAYAWCANGTTSGCGGVFGDSKTTTPFLACGPMFTTDAEDQIQGTIIPIASD
ncbi:hypothetical protein LTR86_004194 [Recurvomyces mirabilis]|nr:hypothetical protein LTR86_004194 [Recurvomyces mirabilis]